MASPFQSITYEEYAKIVCETIQRKTGASKPYLFSQIQVSDTKFSERSDANGSLGTYYKLVVTIEPICGLEKSSFVYFGKTLPLNNPELMKVMREIGMADREHNSYLSLLTVLDAVPRQTTEKSKSWHPHCYYRNEDLLILEDLFDEGYSHVPDGQLFSVQHTESALRTLASMHAASLAYESVVLKGPQLNETHSELLIETLFVPKNSWFTCGMETIVKLVPMLPAFKTSYANRWCPTTFLDCLYQIYEEIKPSKEFRNVLSHQDLWTSNILFRPETDGTLHAKLIDFQCFRYLPPAVDILHMLLLTTRRSDRTANLSNYLKFYHQELSAELLSYGIQAENILQLEELMRSSETLRILPLVNASFLLPWILMPPNTVVNLKRDDYSGYVHMSYVRRIEFIWNLMEKHSQYREIIEETVDELVELVYRMESYKAQK